MFHRNVTRIFVFVLIVWTDFCSAQTIDVNGEWKKMQEHFNNASSYSISTHMDYYFPSDSLIPIDTGNMFYEGSGNDFYYSFRDYEMVNCQGIFLQIDNRDKEITLRKGQDTLPQWSQEQWFKMINENGGSTPEIKEIGKGLREMNFKLPKTRTPSVWIDYDAKKYEPISITFLYIQQTDAWSGKPLQTAKVRIKYKTLTISKNKFPFDKYGINHFVKLNNGKYTPVERYTGYKISEPVSFKQ